MPPARGTQLRSVVDARGPVRRCGRVVRKRQSLREFSDDLGTASDIVDPLRGGRFLVHFPQTCALLCALEDSSVLRTLSLSTGSTAIFKAAGPPFRSLTGCYQGLHD